MAISNVLLDRLISDNPMLQAWGDGTPANWSVTPDALHFLASLLKPGMRTLETGSGHTTVVFALAGTNHVCVTPDPTEHTRIMEYCRKLGVGGSVRFINGSSDAVLPRDSSLPAQLDVVFLDGAHRFPFPCLDWHYTHTRLPIGGVMAIDDYEMPSVKILHDFLCGEDEWELMRTIDRTAFFRKLADAPIVNDCQGQNINRRAWLSEGRPIPRNQTDSNS
jgi:hypothetical protein